MSPIFQVFTLLLYILGKLGWVKLDTSYTTKNAENVLQYLTKI